jgi:glycosyltransferase involved in cell wall biosynthesis
LTACPQKIALILPSFAGGGAERVMIHLSRRLDRSRFEPMVIILNDVGPLRDDVPDDVTIISLDTPSLRNALPRLYSALRRASPDIVLSTMGYLNMGVLLVARWALSSEARIVVREANMPSVTLDQLRPAFLARLGYRYLYPRADAIICNATRVSEELARMGAPLKKIKMVANPVDIDALREMGNSDRRDAPMSGRSFVAIGRLTHQKGFDRLISWLAEMPNDDRLTIMGDGPMRGHLENLVAEHKLDDRIEFDGFRSEPWSTIAQADAFLMPSRWEGMPNAALEALALGTPVIATSESGGLPELQSEVPDEMLIIANGKDEFIAAMEATSNRKVESGLRANSLPARFEIEEVMTSYGKILSGGS